MLTFVARRITAREAQAQIATAVRNKMLDTCTWQLVSIGVTATGAYRWYALAKDGRCIYMECDFEHARLVVAALSLYEDLTHERETPSTTKTPMVGN